MTGYFLSHLAFALAMAVPAIGTLIWYHIRRKP
jgi:hypothetical protein